MRAEVQRQCDGNPTANEKGEHDDCESRLEVSATGPDTRGDVEAYQAAWCALAAALGWRRVGPIGEAAVMPHVGVGGVVAIVPFTKTWLCCPACVKRYKIVCARCLFAECSCMGGPRFDGTIGTEDVLA